MTAPDPGEVTALLVDWRGGDDGALERLVPLVYDELRRLARAQVRRDAGASLQPTELVAEAYMRLIDAHGVDWKSRAHFFSLAARSMRRVLVDRYRRREADRRRPDGGTFLTLDEGLAGSKGRQLDLDRLDDALASLEKLDPRQAEIVQLRFFGGLQVEEVAEVLDVSPRTVKRDWASARIWLYRELAADAGTG